jgi:hypothetical protein
MTPKWRGQPTLKEQDNVQYCMYNCLESRYPSHMTVENVQGRITPPRCPDKYVIPACEQPNKRYIGK